MDADPTHAAFLAARPARFRGYERTSRYLVMRDGTRIAIDVCLPKGLGAEKVPTIVRQTRYFRRFRVAAALRRVLSETTLDPMNAAMRQLFTSRGYAWVDVDARGSGASFGERPCPWWLDGEVADGAEVCDFVVAQPWSNGLVGSTGVSYEGTTADFLAITQHPAVRAIAPRFSLFDVFTDVAFPGGVHNAYFTEAWETANAALDRNAPGEMVALVYSLRAHGAKLGSLAHRLAPLTDREGVQRTLRAFFTRALAGVAPVDDDPDGELLALAIRSHADNFNVHEAAVYTTFRDDSPPNVPIAGSTSDAFSPHTYADRIRDDVAVLGIGGWYDGAYAAAAIKRQAALGGSLLIGPWVHGGQVAMDPQAPATFDHAAELLRFFDRALTGESELPPVRYFMMGAQGWRSAPSWPPPGTRAVELGLAEGHRLVHGRGTGEDVHEVDLASRAGRRTRWRTLLCPYLHADGKGRSGRYLVYESEPLAAALAIAGSPVLVLRVAASGPDVAFFAYLEEVDGAGQARQFTEGVLRSVHRTAVTGDPPHVAVSFDRADALALGPWEPATHAIELLPTAIEIPRGHRLRLTLGGADLDHFTTPKSGPVTWRVDRAGSRLILPVT